MQLAVIGYVIGFSIIFKKTYNAQDVITGVATIKIKGSGYKNVSNNIDVYDSQDLVVPPTMQGAFFITTRFHSTVQKQNQVCSLSADNTSDSGAPCTSDDDCVKDELTYYGLQTGTCGEKRGDYQFCNIQAWCPLEKDPHFDADNQIIGVKNFSIFIRTNTQFPTFGITLTSGKDPVKGLSLFLMDDILKSAVGNDEDEFTLYQRGAVILAKASFKCDANQQLDVNNCAPNWDFSRIDEGDGFNFRTVQYNSTDDDFRLMKKLYGVRVVVSISGTAGRFDVVILLVALGAGLGLLGIASLVTDFLLQNFWPDREKFLSDKFSTVNLEDQDLDGSIASEYVAIDDEKAQPLRSTSEQKKYVLPPACRAHARPLPCGHCAAQPAPCCCACSCGTRALLTRTPTLPSKHRYTADPRAEVEPLRPSRPALTLWRIPTPHICNLVRVQPQGTSLMEASIRIVAMNLVDQEERRHPWERPVTDQALAASGQSMCPQHSLIFKTRKRTLAYNNEKKKLSSRLDNTYCMRMYVLTSLIT